MFRGQLRSFCSSGANCEPSEQLRGAGDASEASQVWGCGERSERRVGVWRAKRAAGGGAAGRPRIVAEGDVLRVEEIFVLA